MQLKLDLADIFRFGADRQFDAFVVLCHHLMMLMYLFALSLSTFLAAFGWMLSPWLSLAGLIVGCLFLVSMFIDTDNKLWQ
jgi:uncharacterized membrane protein